MQLEPGAKISEAEIAAQFGISRQPVRDAFRRLENRRLLLIRPQRATEVRRFSMRQIEKARFIRSAIEKEVELKTIEILKIENIRITRTLSIISNPECYKSKAFDLFSNELYTLKQTIEN